MHLSKSSIYGLRASILLTKMGGNNSYVTIRELSEELNISFHFLTKILQELSKSEILESFKGPNGGVRLARTPDKITFIEIVTAIESNYIINKCPLGLNNCSDIAPCPLNPEWLVLKEKLGKMMTELTLEDLSARSQTDKLTMTTTTHYQ